MEGLQILGFSQTFGTHEQSEFCLWLCPWRAGLWKGAAVSGEITLLSTLIIFQSLHMSVPAPHVEAVTQLSQGLC